MAQASTSSIEIVNTGSQPLAQPNTDTQVSAESLLPFALDMGYKGDEVTSHAARILGQKDTHGWEVLEAVEDLALVHYTKDADLTTHGHLRGVLLDLETDAIIADSFGYTPTAITRELKVDEESGISVEDTDGVNHHFALNNVVIKRVFEGVVIRVIWHKGKLRMITHRRVDASRSRWGSSKYFITMYQEAGGPTAEQLFDTSKPFSSTTYDFLVVDQALLVGTRQKVNKPYIVFLAQRTVDPKRSADQVAPGRASFTVNERIGGSVNESMIHEPKNLTLAEANHHLKFGYYNAFNVDDERQLTGEAVIVYRMVDGVVADIVKVHSPAYDWRLQMRGNNANIQLQFYCLLNTVYADLDNDEAWEAFKKRYVMLPLYDEESLKESYAKSGVILMIPTGETTRDDYSTRDARIHLLWMNYLLSLPPHAQGEALNLLSQFKKDRADVIAWLQDLEQNTHNIETADVPDRVKGLISSSRRLARDRIAKGENYSAKGSFMKLPVVIKSTLRNLVFKENGPSLYSLNRSMKQIKAGLPWKKVSEQQ